MSATTKETLPVKSGLPPFAAALPADLSHSPVLGVIGVILGAGIVTLAGRLLTLGLADLKGNVGLGIMQSSNTRSVVIFEALSLSTVAPRK